jgi:hypothetical protein
MASLLYDDINSALLRKVTDYDFLKYSVDDVTEQLTEYLHSAISKPYCRRLFSSLEMDDEISTMTYGLKQVSDENQDRDFVIEMLSLGMLIEWLEPMLNSKLNLQQMITSSKESKFYSQAQHLSTIQNVYDNAVKKQRDLIRDRGYIYNGYLGGNNVKA